MNVPIKLLEAEIKQKLSLWRDAITRPGVPLLSQTIAIKSLVTQIVDEYQAKFDDYIAVDVIADSKSNGWHVKFRVYDRRGPMAIPVTMTVDDLYS